VKAIVLAAGYATRLRPLTDTLAKPLLPVAGRPMVEWIVERIAEVEDVDAVHVVTNARYAPAFEAWAAGAESPLPLVVHDDGTVSNDDRLGAIGDVRFTVERAGLEGEDLLVIAGDNLFAFSLAEYVEWWRAKGVASALAVHDVGTLELARQYGIVELGEGDRVVGFLEKPEQPPSTLAATASYLYHRDHVPLVARYLDEGNQPDQPGRLIAWLHTREPVYGYVFTDEWLDIGDPAQLLEADNRMRRRRGLPERAAYALD
jgi:glucose-1-phosphate thymidylyltransferase